MGTYIQPFDFYKIYVTTFLGDANLFAFALVLLVSFISATMNFSNIMFLIILGISMAMFGAFVGMSFYVLIIFLTGFILFKAFSRVVE